MWATRLSWVATLRLAPHLRGRPRPHHEIPNLTTTTITATTAATTTAHQVGDTVGVTLDGGDGPILAASFIGIVITFALGAYFTFN